MTMQTLLLFNLFLTLFDIVLVTMLVRRYKNFWIWSIPIFILLVHGLLFRVVYLADYYFDYQVDKLLYNAWSETLHVQDKLTIVVYSLAILMKDFINHRKFTSPWSQLKIFHIANLGSRGKKNE